MAQVVVHREIKSLRGKRYIPGDTIPNDEWIKVPARNREAMMNLGRVSEDKIAVQPIRKARRRRRKRAS